MRAFLPLSHSAMREPCIAYICKHSLLPYSPRDRADAIDRTRKILDYLSNASNA